MTAAYSDERSTIKAAINAKAFAARTADAKAKPLLSMADEAIRITGMCTR
jgi:hypothetical protein